MERHRREKEEEKASSLSADASTGKRLATSSTADGTRQKPNVEGGASSGNGYVLVSADFNGCIKVFVNRVKPKHSSLPVSAMSWKKGMTETQELQSTVIVVQSTRQEMLLEVQLEIMYNRATQKKVYI